MSSQKQRSTNFELLRLVAIFGIILHHLVIKSASTCGYMQPYDFNNNGVIGLIINGLVVGGVNLFLLISGWFGVKHIFKQVIRLILDCFVYSLVANAFCIFVLGYPFSVHDLLFSCNFLTNWFVVSFVIFLLMSPIIERAMANIDIKTMGYFVMLFTLINVVFGFMLGQLNTNGYNFLNFAYIYMIGRYLRMLSIKKSFQRYARLGYAVWVLCAVPLAIGFVFLSQHSTWTPAVAQRYFGYNNPLVVLSAVALFLPFTQLRIQSAFINAMAKGVFGVFLLHTTSVCIYYRVHYIGADYQQYGYTAILLWTVILFVGCTLVAFVIEKAKAPVYNRIFSLVTNITHIK